MSGNESEYRLTTWTKDLCEYLICPRCDEPLFPAVQLDCCGQRICEICVSPARNADSKCMNCSASCNQAILDKGYMLEVKNMKVSCPQCGNLWIGEFSYLREHLKQHCKLKCENCDEEFIFSIKLEEHKREKCPNRICSCELACLGCLNEVRYSEVEQHYLTAEHQQCLLLFIKRYHLYLHDRIAGSEATVMASEQYQVALVDCLSKVESMLGTIHGTDDALSEAKSRRQIIEAKVIEMRQQLFKINEASIKSIGFLDSIQEIFVETHHLLSEIQLISMSSPKIMDNDDTFTWKVNTLVLLNNETGMMHSDAFQSSQWGYKMRISICLEADSQSLKRFLLIYFFIMRGAYDSILHWPFSYPITVCLVDLARGQNHMVHSIRPDSQAAMFGKPLNEANTPYPISQFCSLEKLSEDGSSYIQDGYMFLKLHICFTGEDVNPFESIDSIKLSKS